MVLLMPWKKVGYPLLTHGVDGLELDGVTRLFIQEDHHLCIVIIVGDAEDHVVRTGRQADRFFQYVPDTFDTLRKPARKGHGRAYSPLRPLLSI